MFARGLLSLSELISIFLCFPVLVLPRLRRTPVCCSAAHPNRPVRILAPIPAIPPAPVAEFDFVHALAAYEALIDSACQEGEG